MCRAGLGSSSGLIPKLHLRSQATVTTKRQVPGHCLVLESRQLIRRHGGGGGAWSTAVRARSPSVAAAFFHCCDCSSSAAQRCWTSDSAFFSSYTRWPGNVSPAPPPVSPRAVTEMPRIHISPIIANHCQMTPPHVATSAVLLERQTSPDTTCAEGSCQRGVHHQLAVGWAGVGRLTQLIDRCLPFNTVLAGLLQLG